MSQWFLTYGYGQVHPDLFIGAYPLDENDVSVLVHLRVTRVLNLVQDAEYAPGQRAQVRAAYAAAGIAERRMDLVDYGRLPAPRIEQAVGLVLGSLREGERTYVHCRAGWQRSAAIAAGVVAIRERLTIEDALDVIRARKPTADPLPHQRDDLAHWWGERSARPA